MKSTTYRELSPADLGYLAGIIDGEGHLGLVRRKAKWRKDQAHYLRPVVQIGQAKREMLDHLALVVGAGSVAIYGTRIFFNLRFYPSTLRWLLPQLLPHLVIKRRQAEILIEFLSACAYHPSGRYHPLTAEQWMRRELLGEEMRRLNEKPSTARRRIERKALDGTY